MNLLPRPSLTLLSPRGLAFPCRVALALFACGTAFAQSAQQAPARPSTDAKRVSTPSHRAPHSNHVVVPVRPEPPAPPVQSKSQESVRALR